MTVNNTGVGLTGEALLKRIKELGDIEIEDLLRATGWFQGYAENGALIGATGFYEAILEAKGVDLGLEEATEKAKPEVIHKNVSRLALLGYRWLIYQIELDNGFKDKKLAEQQHEFFTDLETTALDLRIGLGKNEAGMVISDIYGVMTQLIAYIRTNRWTPDKIPTREERHQNFLNILKWAKETTMVKRILEIGNMGFSASQVEKYDEFRWKHHSCISNYLRTVTLDYATGSNHQDSEAFAEELQDVKAYLAMLDENSEWTTNGLVYVMLAAIKFDWRSDNDPQENIEFAQKLLYKWVEEGRAIRAEYAKS